MSATSRRLSACRPCGRLPGPCSPCHPLPHPQPSRMLPHAPSTAVLTCLLLEPSPSKRRCRRDHTTALLDTWRLLTTRNQSTPFPPASSSLVYSFPFVHPLPPTTSVPQPLAAPGHTATLCSWPRSLVVSATTALPASCPRQLLSPPSQSRLLPQPPWHLFCAPRDRDPLHVTLKLPLVTPWTSERRGREARTCTGSRPRAAGPQGAGGSGR